jgi:putative FmdB family regulatory protein
MPIYTYWCQCCDSDDERLTKIAERDEQKCNSCGNRLIRAIDRPGGVWAPTSTGGGMKV